MLKILIMFLLLSIIGGTNAPLVKNALKDFPPVLGIIFFLGKLTPLFIIGAIFIILGVFIAMRMPRALRKRNDITY